MSSKALLEKLKKVAKFQDSQQFGAGLSGGALSGGAKKKPKKGGIIVGGALSGGAKKKHEKSEWQKFVSAKAASHKLPSGHVDFKAIAALWHKQQGTKPKKGGSKKKKVSEMSEQEKAMRDFKRAEKKLAKLM